MSLNTHSRFIYGFEVSDSTLWIDFDEGGAEISAQLNIGVYTLTDFVTEISRALNAAGGTRVYSVAVNRTTRIITISATGGNFTLRVATGSHAGTSAFGLAGFTGANRSGAATYAGDTAAGSEYVTQFILQSYVGAEDSQGALYGTVNESASGDLEVVTFGQVSYIELNIKFATNVTQMDATVIRPDAQGVEKLRAFMQYLITRGPLEFMENENTPGTFYSVILESTADDNKGLKYKLKEMYAQGLPGFFETGTLKFRVLQ
jgi:hypothetical protein